MEIEIASPPPPAQHRVASGTAAEGGVYQNSGAACLVWQDLTAVLPNFGSGPTRRLLNGISGYALPGRIMAVMGPSGSGKSTFLDSLAGRLSANVVMSGNIYLNGRRRRFNESIVAYVTQETGFLGTLTVRETITYSAMLRMPNNTTKMELKETVERTITEMGLGDCADTLIGNWHLRGISGGEKRRLSIALEIITQPRLLLLDEPTSGLDSAAAFFIAQALRNVARSGRTIVSSIHQPSSEVFTLFDDLLLLSSGETIYFGEAGMAVEFFAEAGFPCPLKRNPSDHFLRSINSDFDTINKTLMGSQRIRDPKDPLAPNMILSTTEIRARLIQRYQTSKFSGQTRATIRELLATEGPVFENIQGSHATWFKQLTTLTRRSFINMCRDFGYYWLRMIVFITVALSAGSVFYRVGYRTDTIRERGACGGYVSGFMTFMTIGGFPSFVEEMKVFSKERLNRHYGILVYVFSNFLSSFPFLVVMSFGTASIFYFMVHFHPGFSHYIYAVLDLLLSIAVIEGLMMAIAAFVPNFLMGVMIGSGFIGIMMCTAGYFRQLKYLPKIYWRYPIYYINYMSWALKGAFKNEMIGLEFDPIQGGGQKIKGEEVLSSLLGIPINYSKWWDLLAILAILICYRAIFFFALKFKERAMPIYRTYYAKTTLHQLKKRPSFRVTPPSFPSKRHPVVHSLSSQEGLNSPLH